jgi:hypothetical protein
MTGTPFVYLKDRYFAGGVDFLASDMYQLQVNMLKYTQIIYMALHIFNSQRLKHVIIIFY